MKRLVIKFGGTSLMDAERIVHAAQITSTIAAEGWQLAVVVSAMGHTTGRLISLATELNRRPDTRELDLLMATGEQMSAALMSLAKVDVPVAFLRRKERSFCVFVLQSQKDAAIRALHNQFFAVAVAA